MKITKIDTFTVKGLAWPWLFCAVRTDEGITGYSEFGFGRLAHGIVGLVKDFEDVLVGKDPRPVEQNYEAMRRMSEYSFGGATQQAIAGIELALWDIKGKAAGMPVHELLGGPTRSEQRVYWSHLATYQVAFSEILGTPAVESWDDIRALVRQALDAGYTGFKTNFVTPGGGGRRPLFLTSTDKVASRDFLADAVTQIETMRDEAGPDIDIMVDINQNFRPEGQIKIAQALEPYDITWLEIDNLSADALKKVRSSTRTTILTGERLLTTHEYYPYFEAGAMDVIKLDLQWQGLISARQVANMAYHYEMNVAPHNFNGHLSTFQTMNLCATVNNVKISESDPVQTPWRDELFTNVPEISGGMVKIPDGPGWGTDLNEDAAAKYLVDG